MKKLKLTAVVLAASLLVNSFFMTNAVFADSADTETEKKSYELEIRGDLNSDGTVSIFDLMRFGRYLLGVDTGLEVSYATDLNRDGRLSIADFAILKSAIMKDTILWNYKNVPRMDGSTSEIPLETGFKAKMFGIDYTDAKTLVKHHKTHESFKMLLNGENDLILTVPISESQQKEADEAGVHLNFAPVAKEGFVFVVNNENPVDSLTSQQIRDIYSGKITNWKELGGNDETIIPYQRNTDSGSQNYMTEFMKDCDLLEPEREYIRDSMNNLMDAIAVYDNASNSIGYSVYSYAAQMYENSDDVKFIAVDGVEPSRETMADGTYPLLSDSYIIYTDSASQNTLDFVEWALSDEGQTCVLENGYVPVSDIEYPDRLKAYKSKGTGKEREKDYKPDRVCSEYFAEFWFDTIPFEDMANIDFLKNKDFQNEINSDIKKVYDEFSGSSKENYSKMNAELYNGYLSLEIYIFITKDGRMDSIIKTLNYDLINNKRIEKFSDLFYKDMNFVPLVNKAVSSQILHFNSNSIKTEFIGLTGSVDNFTIDRIILPDDNPYLTGQVSLSYDSYFLPDYMITGKYFDNTLIMDENYAHFTRCFESREEWNKELFADENGDVREYITGSAFHSDEETEQFKKIFDKIYDNTKKYCTDSEEYIMTYLPSYPCDRMELNVISSDRYMFDLFEKRIKGYMFDPYTGEEILFSDIFGKEFEYLDEKFLYIEADRLDLTEGKAVIVVKSDAGGDFVDHIDIEFDPEKVNMKYFSMPEHFKEPVKLEKELYGHISSDVSAWASSYILENKPEKIQSELKEGLPVVIKSRVYSRYNIMVECWNPEDGSFYGWVMESVVKLDQ